MVTTPSASRETVTGAESPGNASVPSSFGRLARIAPHAETRASRRRTPRTARIRNSQRRIPSPVWRRSAPLQSIGRRVQGGHAFFAEPVLVRQDVAVHEPFDRPVAFEQIAHFRFGHRERRALLLVRRILQRHQQADAAARQARIHLAHVTAAQVGRQRDQRGPIEERVAVGQVAFLQREHIAAQHVDRSGMRQHALRRVFDLRHQPLLGEELLHRQRRELHAEHAMPARREPRHVHRLARQRHVHARIVGDAEAVPALHQQGRRRVLVEPDLALAPTLEPELAIGPAQVAHSTASPSTFCQPRGNKPPRDARAPTYSSSSLNDSVIARVPDLIDNFPPGGTTATATTRSVPSFAFGMSMSLLPLPLSSSGTSFAANASRCPALVTATTRSVSGLATNAGCTTFAPGVSDSIALPAFWRPVRLTNFVTKPYPCVEASTKRVSSS